MENNSLDNEILRQNKIPGCDQFTRPDEIKALSKYLKKIKNTQEKYTKLGKDNLEIPGRTTGKIPNISKLEDHIELLKDSRETTLYEDDSRIYLNPNDNLESLYNKREKLEDLRDIKLNNKVDKLNIDKEVLLEDHVEKIKTKEELDKLSSHIEKINVIDNLEILDDTRVGLSVEDNNTLDNTKIDLSVEDNNSLEDYVDKLVDQRENTLDDTRVNLSVEDNNSLENYIDKLVDQKENSLDNTRVDLSVEDNNSLEDYVDKLVDQRENSLDDTRVDLSVENNNTLDNTKVSLSVEDNNSLEDYVDKLVDQRENSLDDTRVGLSVEDNNSLEDYVDKLVDQRENTLEDTKVSLSVEDNNSLEDYVDKLVDQRENTLEDTKVSLSVENNNSLEDYVDKLVDQRENSLDDTRVGLSVEDNNSLEDYVDKLVDQRENNLDDTRVDLSVEDNNTLDNTRVGLSVEDNNSLEDYVDKLVDQRENSLENYIDTIIDERENSLNDTKIELTVEDNNSLENFMDNIPDSNNAPRELGDYNYLSSDRISDLIKNKETNFYDTVLGAPEIPDNVPREFGDYNYLSPEDIDYLSSSGVKNFYDSVVERPDSISPENDDKYNYLSPEKVEDIIQNKDNSYDKIVNIPNAESPNNISEYNYLSPENIEKLLKSKKYNYYDTVMELLSKDMLWGEKLQSQMSAYLSGEDISPERANEYEKILENEIKKLLGIIDAQKITVMAPEVDNGETPRVNKDYSYINHYDTDKLSDEDKEYIPPTKLLDFSIDSLNINNYLRYITEKTIGNINYKGNSSLRNKLISETLAALVWARDELERLAKSNRDRLPGSDGGVLGDLVSGGVSGALDNIGNRLGNSIGSAINGSKSPNMSNPINRPTKGESTSGWTSANIRKSSSETGVTNYSKSAENEKSVLQKYVGDEGESSESGGFWKRLGESALNVVKDTFLGGENGEIDYKFNPNYVRGRGIRTTLEELSFYKGSCSSVEELFKLMKESPFITTAGKVTTSKDSGYKVQTLDTNSYWEIILEPYVGVENGGISFLPGLHEINLRNITQHGINTCYNRWIPFVSFDLQKQKMTSKTLSLYDGEISYPVSMEFVNELRLTIADDQYKSWRTYFENCAKAAIYNSEGHREDFYISGTELTAIDTTNVCISMYKNITFRCKIFVMTPQYSTIRKFDLLLVLKDFSEEYTGDIDSGAGDLNISFSIVGENPINSVTFKGEDISAVETDSSGIGNLVGSIVESGVNSIISVLT